MGQKKRTKGKGEFRLRNINKIFNLVASSFNDINSTWFMVLKNTFEIT